jgi:hypothetical protein
MERENFTFFLLPFCILIYTYNCHMNDLRNGRGKSGYTMAEVVSCSYLMPGFNPWLIHVEFVMGKMAVGQVFLSVLLSSFVSSIPPMLHTHMSFGYH